MADALILRVKIDPSGAVTGAKVVDKSLDGMEKSAKSAGASLAAMTARIAPLAIATAAAGVAVRTLTRFLGESIDAAAGAQRVIAQLEAGVRSTGGAAGFTTKQLEEMASEFESVSRFADDAVASAERVLLTFTQIKGDAFKQATQAVLDLATVMGGDLNSAALQVGKSLQDPAEGFSMLQRSGVSFSEAQEELIKKLTAAGKAAEAQQIILSELNKQFGGSALADLHTYSGSISALENAWDNFKEGVGGAVLPVLTNLATKLREMVQGNQNLGQTVGEWAAGFIRFGLAVAAAVAKVIELVSQMTAMILNDSAMILRALGEVADALGAKGLAAKYREAAETAVDMGLASLDVRDAFGAIAKVAKEVSSGVGEVGISFNSATRSLRDFEDAAGGVGSVTANLNFETLPVGTQLQDSMQNFTYEGIRLGLEEASREPAPPIEIEIVRSPFQMAAEDFSMNLQQGATGALVGALGEFVKTGEFSVRKLGEAMLDVLLNAVQQYRSQMLAANAQIRDSNVGSNTSAYGPVQPTGTTGGGMGGALGSMGAVVGAAFAAYAVYQFTKDIKAAKHAKGYGETAVTGIYGSGGPGSLGSTFAGEMDQAGRDVAKSMRDLLDVFQQVAGQWITSLPEIGMRISRNGERFRAEVGGEIIGTFATLEEATLKAFQEAFNQASFSGQVDAILTDMVRNFRGEDVEDLKQGLIATRKIMDEVAGLSEIEAALRDLPFQADAMRAELVSLGASFEDASALAAKWQATQMQNLRDSITGHQQTEAEQRAQKEREALLFNAQLALNKAEIDMKRQKLAADIEILKAGGSLSQAELNLTSAYLGQVGRLSELKADILNQDLQIQQGFLNLQTTAGKAALASLQLQLAALDQVFAILDSIKPIDLKEIKIPGGGGKGVGGQSKADKIADALGSLGLESFNLDQRFKELAETLRYLEAQGALTSERLAELGQNFFVDLLGQMASAIGDEKTLRELEEIRYDLQKANWLLEIERLHALGAINEEQYQKLLGYLNALPPDLPVPDEGPTAAEMAADALNSLGLQSVETQQRLDDLRAALNELRRSGELTAERARELGDQMFVDLADGLLKYVDDEETRRAVEEIRFQMEMQNYRLQFEFLKAQGLLTIEQIGLIDGLLLKIDAAYKAGNLDFQQPNIHGGGGGRGRDHGNDDLERAMDRLRSAIEALREFQEGLVLSDLSPLTIEQQYLEAQSQYQQILAQAMAGDVGAIEQLPDAARTLLELAQQMFDPSGSGYASIFQMIQEQIEAVLGIGQGILDGNPINPNQGVEDRLDDIWNVLDDIRDIQYDLWSGPTPAPPGGRHGSTGGRLSGDGSSAVSFVHDPANAQALLRIERKLERANVISYASTVQQKQSQFSRDSGKQTGYANRVSIRRAS